MGTDKKYSFHLVTEYKNFNKQKQQVNKMVQEVKTLAEYNQILGDNQYVCVDYFATWCGPCRMIAPKIEEFEKTYSNVKFIKVDVDQATEVAEKEGISAMPTFKYFANGEKSGEVVGASESKIEAELKKFA